MQTEIIKLNSLRHSIANLIESLSAKFTSRKDYDITVIVQQCDEESKLSYTQMDQEQPQPHGNYGKLMNSPVVFGEDLSESNISLDDKIQSQPTFRTEKKLEESKIKKLLNKLSVKRRDLNVQQKENEGEGQKKSKMVSNSVQTDGCIKGPIAQSTAKIEDSCNGDSDRYSFKLNNLQIEESQNSQQQLSETTEDESQAGFLLEAHLNQAIDLIENKKMDELEDFLYKFKEKFSFINLRTQTKWSLLMAYCKEEKMEYERAATNYKQVINTLRQSTRIITLEVGDIYNRLGQCYFHIGQWNKGIAAYSQALNHYKKSKKCSEYSNCITNLGVLYLEIGYYTQAEKCFLMAYNIKRNQDDKKSQTYLLSCLFHLVDCNLKMRNYKQSEYLIATVQQIIVDADEVEPMYEVRLYTKKAKLQFYLGNFAQAECLCIQALNLSTKNKVVPIEFAEVLQLMGTLKQQFSQLQKSKIYFQKALKVIQKEVAFDSIKKEVLKKRIDCLSERIQKSRQLKKKTAMMINKPARID